MNTNDVKESNCNTNPEKLEEETDNTQNKNIVEMEKENNLSNVIDETTLDSSIHTKNNSNEENNSSSKKASNNDKLKKEDIKLLVEGLIKNKDVIRRNSDKYTEFVIQKNVEISHSPNDNQNNIPNYNKELKE